jgi:hypothetical protein
MKPAFTAGLPFQIVLSILPLGSAAVPAQPKIILKILSGATMAFRSCMLEGNL